MATSEEYAQWIVNNKELKGTPKFSIVAKAYEEAKAEESLSAGQQDIGTSVLTGESLREEASLPRKIAQSAGKGVTGLVDLVVGAPENYRRLGEYMTNPDMPVPRTAAPLRTKLTEAGVFTPEAEFNTPIGRVAGFTTELAASGGVNPRNVVQAGKSLINPSVTRPLDSFSRLGKNIGLTGATGIVGGSTSELVNSIGVENPAAQFIAPSLMMALTGGVMSSRNTPATVVNDAIKGMSPEQLKAADDLVRNALNQGVTLTGAEAIAQVMGGNRLTSTQRFLEQNPRGDSAQIMANALRNRPKQNVSMFESTIGGVSPLQALDDASGRLQRTAENTITSAEKMRTKASEPFYTEAGKTTISKNDLTGYLADPRIKGAVEFVRSTDKYGVKNMPENDMRVLIAAKQSLDDDYSTQLNAVTGSQKNAGAVTWAAREKLDNFLASKSPQYATGRDIYSQVTTDVVNPLQQGRVGQLAQPITNPEQGIRAQSEILMPKAPRATSPESIRKTVEILRRQDPTVAADWTRQNLQGIFDETTKNLTGGENQFGGAKFAATIAGNKQQKDNLRALVTSSAGMQAWKGFEDMLDVLQAQGQRLPANSATAFNQIMQQDMSSGGVGALASTVAKPSKLANWYEGWRLGKNSEMLAKMLTDPDTVKKLEELAKTGPKSLKSQAIVNSIAGGYIAQKPELEEKE